MSAPPLPPLKEGGEDNTFSLFDIPESLLTHKKDNLYTITAENYYKIQNDYKAFPLPNDILFPWLHGVDGTNNQQNLFFGVRRSLVPNYRGLLLVHCNELETASRLVESVLPFQVVLEEGQFIKNTEVAINLRNFQNQIARFATICDIVLYGQHASSVAENVANAQSKIFKERQSQIEAVKKSAGKRAIVNANQIIYKTIIIEDDFSLFEEKYMDIVMFDSVGLQVNRRDFWELENLEMRQMSGSSEITKNVYIGCTQDVPPIIYCNQQQQDQDTNPHSFSICIEAHDLADMPLPSTITLARERLNEAAPQQQLDEIIHFDMYSTGVPLDPSEFHEFYSRLLCLLKFIKDQAHNKDKRILIHCTDGYTETSLFALIWVMYDLNISLPEAYLYLQKKRSFFVYACDLPSLRKIEHLLSGDDVADQEPEPKRKKSCANGVDGACMAVIQHLQVANNKKAVEAINGDKHQDQEGVDDEDDDLEEDEEDEEEMNIDPVTAAATPTASPLNQPVKRLLQSDIYINTISNTTPANSFLEEVEQGNIYRQLQLSPTKEEERLYPWFYSPRFEGSFPSRILPFLYLGNLNHATNPEMLKALNITHVVSVGENADLNKEDFELLFLDNLYDDGIDSIRPRLDSVMTFVEDARVKGTTCLIHCRVGVSRSAAITICYVMKHLHYTFVQAYLFVRARRLNVIIQPNLKFMYEMLQLEQRETGTITISWPVLCWEIFNLNFSYRDTSSAQGSLT